MASVDWSIVFENLFFSAVILKIIVTVAFFVRQVLQGNKLREISVFYGDQFNRMENRLNAIANLLGICGAVGLLIYYWR